MRLYVRFIAVAVATYNSAHASSMETPVTPSTTNGTGLLTSGKDIVPVPRLASVAVYDDHEATSLAITKNGDDEERTLATTVDKDDEERAAFETIASMFSYPKSKVMSILHAVIAKIKTRTEPSDDVLKELNAKTETLTEPSYYVFNGQGDAVDRVKFKPWIKYATYVDREKPNGEMKAIDFLVKRFLKKDDFLMIFEMAQGLKMPGLASTWQEQLIESGLRLKKTPFDLITFFVSNKQRFDISDLEVWVNFTEAYLERNSKGWLDDTNAHRHFISDLRSVFHILDAAKKVKGKEDIVKKWQEQQIDIWQELGFRPDVVFRIMGRLFRTNLGTTTPYLDRWIKYTKTFMLKNEKGWLFDTNGNISSATDRRWIALIEVLKEKGETELVKLMKHQKIEYWLMKIHRRYNLLITSMGYRDDLDGLLSSPFLLMLDDYLAELNLLEDKKTKLKLIDVLRSYYGEPALKESIERVRTERSDSISKIDQQLSEGTGG